MWRKNDKYHVWKARLARICNILLLQLRDLIGNEVLGHHNATCFLICENIISVEV